MKQAYADLMHVQLAHAGHQLVDNQLVFRPLVFAEDAQASSASRVVVNTQAHFLEKLRSSVYDIKA